MLTWNAEPINDISRAFHLGVLHLLKNHLDPIIEFLEIELI
jgi:hypothetical protein